MYEGSVQDSFTIAEYFGTTQNSLRQIASRRGWKRPKAFYRRGVPKKLIPEERRETARILWESGETAERIGRFLGLSPNKTFDICSEEFGARNIRLARQTYYMRRNMVIYKLRKAGVSLVDLADQYWLSVKSVQAILTRMQKRYGRIRHFRCRRDPVPLEIARPKVMDEEFEAEINLHEKFLYQVLQLVSDKLGVPGQFILAETRGRKREAFARQVAMYIMHCESGLHYRRVGELFGRHQSTIRSNCYQVEDERDDFEFDELVEKTGQEYIRELKAQHDFVNPYELYFARCQQEGRRPCR